MRRHQKASASLVPAGFTLVELLVSIAIMGTLMTISIANFRQPFRYKDLQAAGQQLIGTIRRLQLSATAGGRLSICEDGSGSCTGAADCPGSRCSLGIPVGGYGLAIAACTTGPCNYQTFADTNADQAVGSSEVTGTQALGLITVPRISLAQANGQGVCGEPATVSAPATATLLFRATSTVAIINNAPVAASTCAVAVDLATADGSRTSRILFSLVSGIVTVTE